MSRKAWTPQKFVASTTETKIVDNDQPGGICIGSRRHTTVVTSNTFLRVLIECEDTVDMSL